MTLLDIQNLKVHFKITNGIVKAVDDISFTLDRGETMGLVGESGCGKTTTAFASMRLLPKNGFIVNGKINFNNSLIAEMDEEEFYSMSPKEQMKNKIKGEKAMRERRWSEISMIFQSAMNAFNPVYKTGKQIEEVLLLHTDMSRREAKERVGELFDLVGMDPSRAEGYPHEFSGGMKQRAMIAMALALNPDFIIADEPTTALDVIMQDRILLEIKRLQEELDIAMMIITHDISVVAEVSQKIGIMYAGKLFEFGDIKSIFANPANPYSLGLMNAFPSIKGEKKKLMSIPGSPPDLSNPPQGCTFHPRCKFAQDICREKDPETVRVENNHFSKCHFAKEVYAGELR